MSEVATYFIFTYHIAVTSFSKSFTENKACAMKDDFN